MPTWHDTAASPTITCRVGTEGAIETNVAPNLLGSPWVPQVSGVSVTLYGVAWNGFRFVTVGENGTGLMSEDGAAWAPITMGVATDLFAITAGGNVFIAVGAGGVILASQNGIEWSAIVSGTTYDLWDVTTANAEYIAVGDNDVIVVGPITSTLLDIILAPTVAVTSEAKAQAIFSETLIDSVGVNDVPSRATFAPVPILAVVTEHLGMEDQGATDVGGVVETGFSETSTSLDAVVSETMLIDEVGAGAYQGDTAELFFMFLNDEAGMSSVQSADQMVANSDAVDSFTVDDRPFLNNDTLTEAFALSTTLTGAYGKAVLEDIGLNDALAALSAFSHLVTDSFAMDDVPSSVGTMLITVGETVVLDDTLSISQTINGLINEGITFSVAITLDGETYLAWVMNTETYGVTNYENFRFNSMCGFNGVYYATDGTKIYRLDGQTDDGTAIDAEISLGASDFGSAFLKRMERAYLGLRADGQMVLKVITDEKAEDWYTLESVPSALGESHVKIGKGLKARYWRLALRNKGGSDFTLDSLRLLPLKLSRRV